MTDAINSAVWIWVLLCGTFLALEVLAIAGIGFLYAGLAALTMGGLITANIIDAQNIMAQIAAFFGLTGLWAVILWVPMKKMLRKKGGGYNNFIGDYAVVCGGGLTAESPGIVKWSGTTMRARIDSAYEMQEVIAEGASVIITRLDGNVLSVVRPETHYAAQNTPENSKT